MLVSHTRLRARRRSHTHADSDARTHPYAGPFSAVCTKDSELSRLERERARAQARRRVRWAARLQGDGGLLTTNSMAGFSPPTRRVVQHALRCSMLGSTAFQHRAAAQRDGGRLTANATPPTAAATISPILRSPALSSTQASPLGPAPSRSGRAAWARRAV